MMVGPNGHALGIDMTPAMVEKARQNAARLALGHVTVALGDIANLPFPDESVDVVLSNGVINLSEHKPCVLMETFRVLRPRGRLCIADMVREGATTAAVCDESWAGCVAGTVEPERYMDLLTGAGFRDAALVAFTGYKTATSTIGALFRASKPA